MVEIKMTTEEFNMVIVALQNTAKGCEQTVAVLEKSRAIWRARETREMAAWYDQLAVDFRNQVKQGGKE